MKVYHLKRFHQVVNEMAFATHAFNKERELVQHLQSHGLMDTSSQAAGPSARGTDFTLKAGKKTYNGEYKQDIHAGMGQMEVRHNPKAGPGKNWAPSERNKGTSLLKHWHSAKSTVNGQKLSYPQHINQTWGPKKPSGNYTRDMTSHKSVYSDWGSAHNISAHYKDRGVHYVQIGDELFHTDKDHAKLGTTHLDNAGIETRFRTRVKGRGHDKKTGNMKYGFLTTLEARRKQGAKQSSASLYNPKTLQKLTSLNTTP